MSTFIELMNDWLNYDKNASMNECLGQNWGMTQ